MPVEGFLLFASRNGGAMDGVSIRYLRFDPNYLDDAQVRSAQQTSVYSQWQAQAAKASREFFSQLSLKALYKRPPAVWQETAYICEFGDACVEGTGLDGSTSVFGAMRVFSFVLAKLWEEQQAGLNMLPSAAMSAVAKSQKVLAESTDLARQYELAQKNPSQLINFVRKFRKRLEAMEIGDTIIVPAGFALAKSSSPFVLVLERTSEDAFMLAVINPGLGVEQYHVASATTAPPKIQSRFALSFEDVARENLLDDAWWLMLWRTGFIKADINTPDKLYNDLLPLLLKKPLEAAIADNKCHIDDSCCPLRTNQRSKLTGYRCVREAWLYLLNRHGASRDDSRQVYFTYQQQWLKMLLHDLHCAASIDESDVKLVRLSMKQVAHLCTKKMRPSDPARFLDDQLAILRSTTQGIEARLAVIPVQAYKEAPQSIDKGQICDGVLEGFDREQSFFERFHRVEDVSGLAGARKEYPDFVPIDFLLVQEQAMTLDEALDATRWADKLCTLCSAQSRCVKNAAFYKVSDHV